MEEENKRLNANLVYRKLQLTESIPISVIQNKKNFILDTLRKHKPDLDYETWSEYKISGSILFVIVYLLEELDKLKE